MMVIVNPVLIQTYHRWWDDKEIRLAVTTVQATDYMTIILITVIVASREVMMGVTIPSRDYKKDVALIVAVMKIVCSVQTMTVIILQLLPTSHKVSTQDQSYPHGCMPV